MFGDAVSHSAIETIPTRMSSAKGTGIERFPRRLLRVHHTIYYPAGLGRAPADGRELLRVEAPVAQQF